MIARLAMRTARRPWAATAVLITSAMAMPLAQAGQVEPAEVLCPSVLGVGVTTDIAFCDVLIQEEPGLGVMVVLPPRRGEATLAFNLHNRHAYSAEEVEAGRGYARYQAEVAVASMEAAVLARRYVLSEFRAARDLVDRVGGGAGAEGIKAIAPTGLERVYVTIPAELDQVAIVGQSLEILRFDGSRDSVRSLGRPVAVISEVQLEYEPR